ncbi:MAG: alpha/beta hydrolase-fold protein [Acidobacteria bacterium]|nr:alpha/beta hydrolase-fold protein [Acidobacteriota bacterium]
MTLDLLSLEVDPRPTPEAIDQLLAERSFPLVEDSHATFAYRGQADEVNLRHWIYGLPSSQPFRRLGESDLWILVLEIPEGSRFEYKIEVIRGRRRRLIRDPLNELLAHDPFGANSVLHGTGYETPAWAQPIAGVRSGSMLELEVESQAFGEPRSVQVYLPARRRRRRRYPLLIVHDGGDYLRFAALRTVLDNLIDALEIQPLVVALIDSPQRLVEYAADPRHSTFLAEELLPRLEVELPVLADPASRALMGASFGAVAALAGAWQNEDVFGQLLLQSGSFAFSDLGERHARGPTFDPVVKFMNRFRDEPRQPAQRMFVSCGVYESLIYENRSLIPLLQRTGADVRFVEARDGHNWENWRDRLREGLSWLFPGPLWMVYE